ncbi:MAG: mechanosensitive ion channel domain-containing protein [Pseudomonadota bacterium]
MQALQDWFNNLSWIEIWSFSWHFVVALLIFIIGRWIAKAIIGLMRKAMTRKHLDEILINFVGNIVYVFLLLSVILIAISYLGIAVTPLIAVLGGAALAVGLALQASLSNFASGLMLVGFRPFDTNDFVEAGGVSGTVKAVGIFQTELVTPDNRHVIVPNSEITSQPITNYSAFDTRRIDLVLGVGYSDDLKTAQAVMKRVVEGHDLVLNDPAPNIMLMELADSSVNFAIRPWVKTSDYWAVRSDLLESLKAELEAAGCSIPFPQREVHYIRSEASE